MSTKATVDLPEHLTPSKTQQVYTVVQHSGTLTNHTDFLRAVESRGVHTVAQARAIREAGGLLFSDYGQAEDAAERLNYQPGAQGIVPNLPPGGHWGPDVDGLRAYVPPPLTADVVERLATAAEETSGTAATNRRAAGIAQAVALAATARLHWPEAAFLVLDDSDQGPYVNVVGVEDVAGNDLGSASFSYASDAFEDVGDLADNEEREGWGDFTDKPRKRSRDGIDGRRLDVAKLLATVGVFR